MIQAQKILDSTLYKHQTGRLIAAIFHSASVIAGSTCNTRPMDFSANLVVQKLVIFQQTEDDPGPKNIGLNTIQTNTRLAG